MFPIITPNTSVLHSLLTEIEACRKPDQTFITKQLTSRAIVVSLIVGAIFDAMVHTAAALLHGTKSIVLLRSGEAALMVQHARRASSYVSEFLLIPIAFVLPDEASSLHERVGLYRPIRIATGWRGFVNAHQGKMTLIAAALLPAAFFAWRYFETPSNTAPSLPNKPTLPEPDICLPSDEPVKYPEATIDSVKELLKLTPSPSPAIGKVTRSFFDNMSSIGFTPWPNVFDLPPKIPSPNVSFNENVTDPLDRLISWGTAFLLISTIAGVAKKCVFPANKPAEVQQVAQAPLPQVAQAPAQPIDLSVTVITPLSPIPIVMADTAKKLETFVASSEILSVPAVIPPTFPSPGKMEDLSRTIGPLDLPAIAEQPQHQNGHTTATKNVKHKSLTSSKNVKNVTPPKRMTKSDQGMSAKPREAKGAISKTETKASPSKSKTQPLLEDWQLMDFDPEWTKVTHGKCKNVHIKKDDPYTVLYTPNDDQGLFRALFTDPETELKDEVMTAQSISSTIYKAHLFKILAPLFGANTAAIVKGIGMVYSTPTNLQYAIDHPDNDYTGNMAKLNSHPELATERKAILNLLSTADKSGQKPIDSLLSLGQYLAVDLKRAPSALEIEQKFTVMTSRAVGSLEDKIRELKDLGTVSESTKLAGQVLRGMADLHTPYVGPDGKRARMVHGDVKLENVLLYKKDNTYSVKVSDFGKTAPVPDGEERIYSGNPRYAPPENALSAAGDVWGTAIMLIEILEARFLNDQQKMLINPSSGKWFHTPKNSRVGIERFMCVSSACPQHDGNMVRRTSGYLSTMWRLNLGGNATHQATTDEVHKYIDALGTNLKAESQAKPVAIDGIVMVLKGMTAADPKTRWSMEHASEEFDKALKQLNICN